MAVPTRSTVLHHGNSLCMSRIITIWIFCFKISLSSAVMPPIFTEHPESQVITNYGKAVVLRCAVSQESADIHWKFDGKVIKTDPEAGYEINGGRLQIQSFQRGKRARNLSHEGIYQCVANNSVGTIVSREATLERAFMGQFEDGSEDIVKIAIEGNTALIPCTPPRGVPPPVTTFKLNGVPIDPLSKRHLILPSGNLQISTVKQTDRGNYKCVSHNTVSDQKRESPRNVRLEVRAPTTKSPPEFVMKPVKENVVIQGDAVTLECVVQGSPVPVVVWDKHKGKLPDGRYTQVSGNLVIRDVQLSDQGTYICRAQNDIGPPMAEIANIKVIERPTILFPPTDQIAIDGAATVAFRCVTNGGSVTSEWLFNGLAVVSNQHISIADTSLTITRVSKQNAGIYQCVARSRLGMTTAEAYLQVKNQGELNYTWPVPPVFNPDSENIPGKPTEETVMTNPTSGGGSRLGSGRRNNRNRNKNPNDPILVVPNAPEIKKLSDTSVTVTWDVPTNDGLPISFFKIQFKEISAKTGRNWKTYSADISSRVRSQEVRRLKTGSTYKFRVSAVYSNQDHRWSKNSKRFKLDPYKVVPTKPTPKKHPIIVKAEASSSNRIEIQWQYNEDKSKIEGFYIYVEPYSEEDNEHEFKKIDIRGKDSTKYVIRHLKPDTHYRFKMTCYNSAGEGPDSNVVVKETIGGLPHQKNTRYTNSKYITTTKPSITYEEDRDSTAKSNQMMYIGLGIVLVLVLLGLLLFMFLCWRKQRKMRRGLNSCQSDSLRKKPQMNGGPQFLLHDLHPTNGKIGNGHVSTGYGGQTHSSMPNGTQRTGLTMNPFQHHNDGGSERNYSPEDLEIQSLRASLQEMLHQPPPPIPPERGAPQAYASINRRNPHNYYEVDPHHQDTLPRAHMDTFGCPDCSHHGSRPQSRAESHLSNQAPPDYNSLNMRGHIYSNRMSGGDYRDYTGSLHRNKPMTNPYHLNKDHYRNSPDHIPRSHERPPFKPYNSQSRNIRTLPSHEQYDRGSPSIHDTSQGSIDPNETYERVSDNQSLGSHGRSSRQRKISPGMPPLLTSSLGYRSFGPGHENSRASPVLSVPQPMKMGILTNPPLLPPRNTPPILYSNMPESNKIQHELNQTSSHKYTSPLPDQTNADKSISEDKDHIDSVHSNKESPQVIDDLSQDLPIINGSLGGGGTETDTLPSSSNHCDPELSLSENMDSDLEGMQLSDHEGDDVSHPQVRNHEGSDEELTPLVVNPSQLKTANNDDGSSENTPLMQRNIPRANDYPSDDDNEDV